MTALYAPVFEQIHALLFEKASVIVAIDGRSGSGKSSLAALLAQTFSCNVFHMDDFYLPKSERSSNWQEVPAGNMDLSRFLEEVLLPARLEKDVVYRPYNCQGKDSTFQTSLLPHTALTVIEGSYSHHPLLSPLYDWKIFLTCSEQEQHRRLSIREGSHFPTFLSQWIPMEERYFKAFSIVEKSSFVLNTGSASLP